MSLRIKLVSSLIAITIAAGAVAGTAQPSAAHHLTPAEAAAIAGVGGFIIGSAIAGSRRGSDYRHHPRHRRSSWDWHVERCFDRYRSYDPASDTYIGYDGRAHYCTL